MVEKDFLEYINDAFEQYQDYKKKEGKKDFEFRDFLMIIAIWKLEEILERLEEKGGE